MTAVEIPSLHGGYHAFYNAGGPGPTPFPGVGYSAPGRPGLQPVLIALDDPMSVSRTLEQPLSGGCTLFSVTDVTYKCDD